MTNDKKPDIRRMLPVLVVDGIFVVAILASVYTGRGNQVVLGDFTLLHVLVAAMFVASSLVTVVTIVLPAMRAKRAERYTVWERKG